MIRVSVSVVVRVRVRVRVRAKWATEELPKAMAAYVRVYFKLKYTGYVGIFCPVYFVR